MTSDGIRAKDWSRVHSLAVAIANASANDDSEAHAAAVNALRRYLDALKSRYGALPSIVATEADYVESVHGRVRLLKIANRAAASIGDGRNLVMTASSLAEAYLEMGNALSAQRWLLRLKAALRKYPDRDEMKVARRLTRRLSRREAQSM